MEIKKGRLLDVPFKCVNTHILIYKDVFDFIFEFEIFIKLNGNEITTFNDNILIYSGLKGFFGVNR